MIGFNIVPNFKGKNFFVVDTTTEFLGGLSERLESLVKNRLWLKVLIGLVAGIVVGAILGPDLGWIAPENAHQIGGWLALPGKLFLGLIGMVVSILVLASIIIGLSQSSSGEQLKTIGLKFTVFVVLTTSLAAALGIGLGLTIQPGSYVELKSLDTQAPPPVASLEKKEPLDSSVPDLIAGLIPRKPLAALAEGEMLGIVIFSILLGIACTTADREKVKPFLNWVESIMEVSMTVVKWAMLLAPWAVFGLMAQLISNVGFDTIIGMGVYVLTVLFGLFLLLTSYFLLVTIIGRQNPFTFASNIAEAQLLAFSTSSSAAVMPLSIKTAVEKLKVPESIASLVVPLGATVNMAGTALYQAVAIIFLAQMAHIQLSVGELSMIVVTLVASSIGSPGTPGVGLVILGNIAGDFGIPTEGLVLIMGVDRILDMSRTVVNLTGDLTACILLGSAAPLSERITPVDLSETGIQKIPI